MVQQANNLLYRAMTGTGTVIGRCSDKIIVMNSYALLAHVISSPKTLDASVRSSV